MSRPEYLPVTNAHGTRAPAFAVAKVSGADADRSCYNVTRPDTDDDPGVLVVGETSIDAGATGKATAAVIVPAAYDADDGTPAAGEEWGPGAGSWKLRKGKQGFRCIVAGGSGVAEWVRVPVGRPLPAGDCVGCGWLAGLDTTCCLTLEIMTRLGRCECTPEQTLYFLWDETEEMWVSTAEFEFCDGTSAPLFFWIEEGRPRLQAVGGSRVGAYEFVFDCCATDEVYFSGGTVACDNGDEGGECVTPSENLFRVRITVGCNFGTECCPGDEIPGAVYVTFSNGTGALAEYNGMSFALVNADVAWPDCMTLDSDDWYLQLADGYMRLSCSGGAWLFTGYKDSSISTPAGDCPATWTAGDTTVSADSVVVESCDPLLITLAVQSYAGGGGQSGSADAEVTI